jgi:hypothetical protein
MSRFAAGIIVIGLLVVAGLGVGGYFIGQARAPSDAEALEARQEAEAEAEQAAEAEAFDRGREEGLAEGRSSGESRGSRAGKLAGESDAGAEAAEATEATETAATPEDLCADSIGDPSAYGQCLEQEGQDPGAPLTDYCAAHPEIVAQAGYCPSLNE